MSNRARLGFGREFFFFFRALARSLSSFFPLSSAADPLTSRARHRRVSEKGGRSGPGLGRAWGSPPPSWLPAEPPRPRSGPEHAGAARARRYHVSRAVPSMCLCLGTRGQGDTHTAPRHTHSSAGGPCGGFPGRRGHGAAAPCPGEGVGNPFLLDISVYRRWRRLGDGRGKLLAQGRPRGLGSSAYPRPGRNILPAGLGRARRGLARGREGRATP